MRWVKSCGVILFKDTPTCSFLVLKHANRFDLPKGHIEKGENEVECALRELYEETSISRELVLLDPEFRFETVYYPHEQQFSGERVAKTVVIFLAHLKEDVPIIPIEHSGFEWVTWNPPHHFNHATIDGVLIKVAQFVKPGTCPSGYYLPGLAKKMKQGPAGI
jgi:bis(5'-nucleosidyl)-tetraphosphatase